MIPLFETLLLLVVAFCLLGFFLYSRWQSSGSKHVITQQAFLFSSLFCFITAAVGVLTILLMSINPSPSCDWLLTNESTYFVYGNNYSGYHWDYDVNDVPACSNPNDFDCVKLFHEEKSYTYTNSCASENFDIIEALYMVLIAIFGMLIIVTIIVFAFEFIKTLKKVFQRW